MLIAIGAKELRRALAAIEKAEQNGFEHCLAVFDPSSLRTAALMLAYSDLWERASANDPSLDWGRFQGVTRRNRWNGSELVPLKSGKAAAAVDPGAGITTD